MTQNAVAGARYGLAGSFLEALAAQDFDRLAATLTADAALHALVPAGVRTYEGPDEIRATYAGWFGNTEDFELAEAAIGAVGSRLYLRWRIRLRAARLGIGWYGVEQHGYADTTEHGSICQLRLLCSGYCAERSE